MNETAKLLKNPALGQVDTDDAMPVNTGSDINSVHRGNQAKADSHNKPDPGTSSKCNKCGKYHAPRRCPAYNTKCRKCGRVGHWAISCRSSEDKAKVNMVSEGEQPEGASGSPGVYLDSVVEINNVEARKAWYSNVKVHCSQIPKTVRFKLNTGAALSVCGPGIVDGVIRATRKSLYGPGRTKLSCLGVVST